MATLHIQKDKIVHAGGIEVMNTARKLGPHTETDRETCPGVGLWVYTSKDAT